MTRQEINKKYFDFKKQLGFRYCSFFLRDREKTIIKDTLTSSKREKIFNNIEAMNNNAKREQENKNMQDNQSQQQ